MAGQEMEPDTEKLAWYPEPQAAASSSDGSHQVTDDLEKSVQTANRIHNVSSTAIRSVQHSFSKVSSASGRLYRHSWTKVSSASSRLYEHSWPKVLSRTVRIYQHVSPKLSSVRLYRRTCSRGPSTAIRHECPERLPPRVRLQVTSMTLRLLQSASALYVFMRVTESFRSKITYDGRVRQIHPIMLTTLIYSAFALVCFLLLHLAKKLRTSAWHIVALASIPGDVSMACLFIAKDIIFGVHSFECAVAQGTLSALQHNDMDPLELRGFHGNRPSHGVLMASARDVCLVPSSVYIVCVMAALSYLGSVTLTIRQLLIHRKCSSVVNDSRYPGHVEQAIQTPLSRQPPQMMSRGRSLYHTAPPRAEPNSSSESTTGVTPGPRPTGLSSQDPKYANLPAGLIDSMVVAGPPTSLSRSSSVPPRISCETTSSMDPDQYVVSDGFRPCNRPPSYTSSRESSQGPPEYRSRPPSLHTVVLVGP